MDLTCRHYFHKLKQTMQNTTTVEIIMGASRHGGNDCEVYVCWAPDLQVGGYLPPQVHVDCQGLIITDGWCSQLYVSPWSEVAAHHLNMPD